MNLDDHVCLCFRVSRRKLLNWMRLHQPRVASQLSECGGAGTGCGWCVPFLKQIHQLGLRAEDFLADQPSLDDLSAEDYARHRAEYVRAGKGTPPSGSNTV